MTTRCPKTRQEFARLFPPSRSRNGNTDDESGSPLKTLDNQYISAMDLNMHFEDESRLFFFTLKIHQRPQNSSDPQLEQTIWRSDLALAEENFARCIEFGQRLLQNLGGKINLKRRSHMEKILEIELPLFNRIPRFPAMRDKVLFILLMIIAVNQF